MSKPTGEGHGGSYSRYFANKNTKLREQFTDEERERFNLDPSISSSIFAGVVIYVNGHTVPSQQQLKHLMALHGGGFESFYQRPPVTHFVCSHLPLAKVRQLRKERNPIPVVKPEWITASIDAGSLLPIQDFSLHELSAENEQKIDGLLTKRVRVAKSFPSDEKDEQDIGREKELAYLKNADLSPAGFIKNFFEHSRLHFIGTWKMRIEAFMQVHRQHGPKPIPINGERQILHVDMDCFFASVATLKRPELKEVPFVVCHSSNKNGTAEISCANYPARHLGIHAGTFISNAMRLCPDLEVVPYQFHDYHEISEKVYEILMKFSACVEPVSCDEAYLDVTGLGDADELARCIRREIEASTGCTASAGIGPNRLLSKIATCQAKPNGQSRVLSHEAKSILAKMPIDSIPGIGWSLAKRMKTMGLETVEQLQKLNPATLMAEFGEKTGKMISDAVNGKDDSSVQLPKIRKSVSAECSWGIRLKERSEVQCCLEEILRQVLHRMSFLKLAGRRLTLKVLTRKKDAPVVPSKFLGCGRCDTVNRSITLDQFTDNFELLIDHIWKVFLHTNTPVQEIRGLGITISKLNNERTTSATLLPLVRTKSADEAACADVLSQKASTTFKRKATTSKMMKPLSTKLQCVPQPVRVVQPDGLALTDVDPHVLAALPETLRREIVQTIPLERDNLFASGNDKLPPSYRTNKPHATELTQQEVETDEWSSNGNRLALPMRIRKELQELLHQSIDVVMWDDKPESSVDRNADPITCFLRNLQTWIHAATDFQMDIVHALLHVVRRLGDVYYTKFGLCSVHFIQSVQSYLRSVHGYELDLDT